MLIRDSYGIIVQHDPNDPFYLDGGDSARATGIMATFGNSPDRRKCSDFVRLHGFVRHPYQSKWKDPKNFSRDQWTCLVSGLYYSNEDYMAAFHWRRQYVFAICPNGDILGPEFYLHGLLCANSLWGYVLYPFLIWFQVLHILWATKIAPHKEQNQTICMAKRSGLLKLWAKLHPDWKGSLHSYWSQYPFRDQKEIADYLIAKIDAEISK